MPIELEEVLVELNSDVAVVDSEYDRVSPALMVSSDCKRCRSNRLAPSSADIMTVIPLRTLIRSRACTIWRKMWNGNGLNDSLLTLRKRWVGWTKLTNELWAIWLLIQSSHGMIFSL